MSSFVDQKYMTKRKLHHLQSRKTFLCLSILNNFTNGLITTFSSWLHFQQDVPARLSYAQMVQRRQATDNVEKQKTDDSPQPAASASVTRPAAQTTLREQSQTQTVNAVSASATPKSACASARSSNKESVRKDFEPREQRFQGSRRSKENRDRQQRPERRRSERDVRVVAK